VDEQNQAYVTIVEINGDNNSYKAEIDDWIDLNEMIKPAVIESGQGTVFISHPVHFRWQILDEQIENTQIKPSNNSVNQRNTRCWLLHQTKRELELMRMLKLQFMDPSAILVKDPWRKGGEIYSNGAKRTILS